MGRAAAIRKRIASAWAFFIDTVEWTSNGDRRRPRFREGTDIHDPVAGWGPSHRTVSESLDDERSGRREG
jgi:hypothetical protein